MFSQRLDTEVRSRARQREFTLVEWIIFITILVGGILACVQAYAGQNGTPTDHRLSTLASSLAEATIETQRHFTWLEAEPDSTMPAYEEIVDGEMVTTMAGVEFVITQRVDDYYWDGSNGQFTTTTPAGALQSDFKRLAVTVSWDDPRGYAIDVAQHSDADPDSGSITLNTVILSSARAAQRLALIDDL
jgi:hypothetical protein